MYRTIHGGRLRCGLAHLIHPGLTEGRQTCPYLDEARCLAAYPDVSAAVDAGTVDTGFVCRLRYGQLEGRTANPPA